MPIFVDITFLEIERANFAFSAVPIAAGPHTVVRRYAPRIWIPAIAGTLLTVVAIGIGGLKRVHTRVRVSV